MVREGKWDGLQFVAKKDCCIFGLCMPEQKGKKKYSVTLVFKYFIRNAKDEVIFKSEEITEADIQQPQGDLMRNQMYHHKFRGDLANGIALKAGQSLDIACSLRFSGGLNMIHRGVDHFVREPLPADDFSIKKSMQDNNNTGLTGGALPGILYKLGA